MEQERGVVAQAVEPRTRGPPPVITDVSEARAQRVIHERLVDSKAVAPVRGIPGIGARPTARESERVEPSEVLEGVQPRLFLRSEHGGFLVDAPAAGVGVSEEQERTAAPATEQGEDVRVEYVLPAARAVRDVDRAEHQRARGFDPGGEPAAGLIRLRPETASAQGPARGDEQAIRARPRAICRRALMPEAEGGEGTRPPAARRRRTGPPPR